jgi:type I restriction enzyme S subunit
MEKQTNIPKLRFPEFSGEWEKKKLGEVLTRYSKINKDEEFDITHILSLSSQFGIVDRKELLDDTYDKVNYKNYIKTRLNDIVYGKSISASYPFGLFKVNNCRDGLLSTLYFTFKPSHKLNPHFFDKYFSLNLRANNFLRKYVLVGDRYITADSDYILSGSFFLPNLEEQTKIASFLTAIDAKIQALKTKKELLQQYKKGVMQQLFSQTLRFKDENGKEFPKWEKKKMGEVCEIKKGEQLNKEELTEFGSYPCLNGGIKFSGYTENFNSEENTITISEGGNSCGFINFMNTKFWLGGHCYKIVITKELNKNYFYQLLKINEQKIMNLRVGSGLPNIQQKDIRNFEFVISNSIDEQTKIANFLSSIDEKINHTATQIEKMEVWKKGLLQKMFV